eukprot:symbB.v1.2.001701.t1/scaffold93.1/size335462/16
MTDDAEAKLNKLQNRIQQLEVRRRNFARKTLQREEEVKQLKDSIAQMQAEASAYRSRAKDSAGWPLIVTEMGVVTEPSKSIGTWNQEANGFGLASF